MLKIPRSISRLAWFLAFGLSVPSANAGDFILLSSITASTHEGELIQLREAGAGGCTYLGEFRGVPRAAESWVEAVISKNGNELKNYSIAVFKQRCDMSNGTSVQNAVELSIPLSQIHTYIDGLGQERGGYGAGDVVAHR